MTEQIFIELKSYSDDGKFIENETGEELTEKEAVKVVIDGWADMLQGYYSWELKAILFRSNDGDFVTEKRFINDIDNGKLVDTKGELSTIYYSDKVDFYELWEFLNKLNDENEQLKSELSRYKELNRLDIWKSSYSSEDALITELQNKCNNKQGHIVLLENKIHRMREAIHKLEWLATYRNGELIRENKQLKIDLGIAEDNRKLDKEIIDDIHNEFQKVKEENEQLKSKYYWYKQYKELLNENEQLKQLLREVEHELTSLTGLSCFDKCASQLGYVEVFDNDRIDLDYSDLLKKIEKVILND